MLQEPSDMYGPEDEDHTEIEQEALEDYLIAKYEAQSDDPYQ